MARFSGFGSPGRPRRGSHRTAEVARAHRSVHWSNIRLGRRRSHSSRPRRTTVTFWRMSVSMISRLAVGIRLALHDVCDPAISMLRQLRTGSRLLCVRVVLTRRLENDGVTEIPPGDNSRERSRHCPRFDRHFICQRAVRGAPHSGIGYPHSSSSNPADVAGVSYQRRAESRQSRNNSSSDHTRSPAISTGPQV